jgi:hypothetical protein
MGDEDAIYLSRSPIMWRQNEANMRQQKMRAECLGIRKGNSRVHRFGKSLEGSRMSKPRGVER